MDPGRCVLVQMGVRVQLERHVGTVNLEEGQLSVQRDRLGRTQQEDHRHAVTHPQDGSFLAVKINRGGEVSGLRISALVISVEGEMVHWVPG